MTNYELIDYILEIIIVALILTCSYSVTTAIGQELNETSTIIDDIVGTMNQQTIGMLMNNTINMLKNSTSDVKIDNNTNNNNITAGNLSSIGAKINVNTFENQTDNQTSTITANTNDTIIEVNNSKLDDNLTQNDNSSSISSLLNTNTSILNTTAAEEFEKSQLVNATHSKRNTTLEEEAPENSITTSVNRIETLTSNRSNAAYSGIGGGANNSVALYINDTNNKTSFHNDTDSTDSSENNTGNFFSQLGETMKKFFGLP